MYSRTQYYNFATERSIISNPPNILLHTIRLCQIVSTGFKAKISKWGITSAALSRVHTRRGRLLRKMTSETQISITVVMPCAVLYIDVFVIDIYTTQIIYNQQIWTICS